MDYTLFNSISGLFNFQLKDGSTITVHLDKKDNLELVEDKGNFKQIISLDDYRIDKSKGFVYTLINFEDIISFEMAESSNPFTRKF